MAAGEHDVRKAHPYMIYDRFDFDVPIGTKGDCYDRYAIRILEMRESVKILRQCIKDIPKGPITDDGRSSCRPREKYDEHGGIDTPIHDRYAGTGCADR